MRLWGPFIVGALVSLVVVAIIAAISAGAQRSEAAALQVEVAQRVAAQLDVFMRQVQNDVTALADTLSLTEANPESQRQLLKTVTAKLNSPVHQVSLVGLDGIERVKAIQNRPRSGPLEDVGGDPAFAAARDGQVYFGPVYRSEDGLPFIDIGVPIRDPMSRPQAVLRAEVDLSTLWALVNAANVGEESDVYIVEQDGTLLAFQDMSRTTSRVDDLPQVRDALQTEAAGAPREYPTGMKNEPVIAYYRPVDMLPYHWRVIAEEPLSTAYAQADLFGLLGLGLSIAALLAIFSMGFFIRQRVARPIEVLRAGAAALAAGDLNHRIRIDTGDELEFLAREFNEMSATLQQSQARLAAMARERERQAEDAQSRVREMSALIQSGRAITSLDLETVLSRLSREVALAVRGDRCSIYVFDARQRRLVLRGEWETQTIADGGLRNSDHGSALPESRRDAPQSDIQHPTLYEWGEGIVGQVASDGKPIFLANAQADRRFVAKAPNDRDIAALIAVPLISENSLVGVLQASTHPSTPPFDPDVQRLLGTFAEQAMAAIKNSFLYETERRRAQEMMAIAEIIRTLTSSLDLETTLDSILQTVRGLIAYDIAEITLWDAERQVLRTRGRGADLRYADYSRIAGIYRLDQGFTGWIATHRSPLLVADVATSEIRPQIDLQEFPIRSYAGVPLLVSQQLVGTLELASYVSNAFNESHVDTLRTIAAQAAVAIQNAQLYQESRQRAEELAGLFRVASITASAQEPDEVLRQIMAEAAGLMSAQLGVVLVLNRETGFLEAHPKALFGDDSEKVRDFRLDTRAPGFSTDALRPGTVFRSNDALSDKRIYPAYRPFIERFRVRSLLSAPLVVRDQHVGEVHIARTDGAPFDLDDEPRVLTLATLLGGVIETARLAAERNARLNELVGLYEISQAVSSLTDLQLVYARITDSIAHRVGVEFAGILLYDAERDALISQPPFYGVPDDVLQHYIIPIGSSPEAQQLWTGGTVWISNDVPNDPLTQAAGLDALAQAVGVKRTLFAAMIVGTRRIGVIQVSNKLDGQPFTEQDARLMSIYATQIAVVVENARLYVSTDVRLHKRVEELTALSRVSQEINSTLDRERILSLVLAEAARATGATHGTIMLIDPGTQALLPSAMLGYTPEQAERIRLIPQQVGEGIIGRAIETGEPVRVDHVHAQPEYLQIVPSTQSELAVPIRYALQVVGAINLESPHLAHFTADHVAFAQALSAQAAIAIGNMQRYEEQLARGELLRRRAEQLANLFEIGQAFRSDRPLVEVLEDVAHAVHETSGFNIAMLSLRVDDPPVLERVAAAGLPLAVFNEMKKVRQPWEAMSAVLQEVFRISQSYYIPMEHREAAAQLDTWPPAKEEVKPRESGQWHEEDLLIIPLRGSGDRVLGILSVDEPIDGCVPERAAIESLELFANQAAIAIENARLLEDLQQRIDSLTLFNQVSRSISARLDLDGLLSTIVEAATELSSSQRATIFLRDEATGRFAPRKAHGWKIEQIAHLTWAEGEGLVGAVAREGRPMIVPDTQAEPRFAPGPPNVPIATMLLVPIAVGGKVIGVLSVDKPTPRSFTNTDLMMLSTLADQAAIAVENAQLFEQTISRTRDLGTLFDATTMITSSLALDRVLDAVGQQLIRALGTHTVAVSRWNRARNQAAVMISRDVEDAGHADRPGTVYDLSTYPGAIRVLEDGRPHVARLSDPQLDELDRLNLEQLGLKALLRLPLIVQDRIIGMVELGERVRDRSFDTNEVQLAQTLANQAAIAIANAELFAETQRRVAELETINAVSQDITATMPLSDLVELIRREVGRVLDVSSFYIALYDATLDRITFPLFYDHGIKTHVAPIPGDAGLTGYIVRTRKPLLLRTLQDQEVLGIPSFGDDSLSYVGVPMLIGEFVSGVMAVQDYHHAFAYDEGHVRTLTTIAAQAAVAVENARLFEETQRRLREQGLLHEAGRAMSASLEYGEVLMIAADQLLRITGLQGVILFEWNRELDQLSVAHTSYLEAAGVESTSGPGHILPLADFPRIAEALRHRTSSLMRASDADLSPSEHVYLEQAGLACALTVPMINRDQIIGAVQLVDMRTDRAFDPSYLRLIETLVNQVASAITNARLFDEVRRFTQELEDRVRQRTDDLNAAMAQLTIERDRVETLFRITSELSASLDLDRVLNRALTLVNEAVGTSRASILLVDAEANMLVHRAAIGRDTLLPPGGVRTPFRPNEGLAGWVIQKRQPVIVPDIRRDPRWVEKSGDGKADRRPYRSALAVPLVYGDDALGSLLLLHAQENYFTDAHLRLVVTAAVQVSTAINNAELYGFIRESAERLGTMLRDKQVESAKAQAILESVTDGVLVADAPGKIILFNAAAERILRRTRESVMGHPWSDLAGLYGAAFVRWEAQVYEWRDRSEARSSVPSLSHRIEFPDDKRFVTVSIAPVTGPGEEFLGTVSVFRDITAEVEADRAKTDFVSTVSHELRTPMTSIKGFADLLLMGAAGTLNENQERFLGIIKANADRLSVLVNDLLDISRIEAGRIVLDGKQVGMASVIDQVVTSLRERIEQKGLTIRVEAPEDDPLIVWGDRDRLMQVLTNLVSNAYQYTLAGGSITVWARLVEHGMLQIDVSDTGIGIAQGDLLKVFDRFFRADDPVVQAFPGTGLGLPIVLSLVHLHGGEMWADSRPGSGSTFSFSLPVSEPGAPLMAEPAQPAPATMPVTPLEMAPRVPRILVVEDDPDIAALISRNLTQVGYEVSTVGTGLEALERIRKERPDLVTLDIFLPDIDGLKVLQTLKSDPDTVGVPIIVVSVMPENKEPLSLGAIEFLAKPLDAALLLDTVSRVLGQAGRILVVEDDLATCQMLTETLQRAGLRVLVTANGRQALTLAKDESPDLILLDLKLPRMDGYTILQMLKSTPTTRSIPVVIMTGSVVLDEARRQEFIAMGASSFLPKPFDVKTLMAQVETLLKARHDRGE